MRINVVLNGEILGVSREQLFHLAAKGTIGPHTPITLNGALIPARRMEGITFPEEQKEEAEIDLSKVGRLLTGPQSDVPAPLDNQGNRLKIQVFLDGKMNYVSTHQLLALSRRGHINFDTPIRVDGNWVMAGRIDGLVFGSEYYFSDSDDSAIFFDMEGRPGAFMLAKPTTPYRTSASMHAPMMNVQDFPEESELYDGRITLKKRRKKKSTVDFKKILVPCMITAAVILIPISLVLGYIVLNKPRSQDIFEAVREGNLRDVQFFLRTNPNFANLKSETGSRPLGEAVRRGDLGIIRALLESGASVDEEQDEQGSRPLHLAVENAGENAEILEYLCSRADLSQKNAKGLTPLAYAAIRRENVKVLESLIKNGSDINAKNERLQTPLMLYLSKFAPERPHGRNRVEPEPVNFFLEHGASVRVKDQTGSTVLHRAFENENIDIAVIRNLLKKGADLNAKNHKGQFPYELGRKWSKAEVDALCDSLESPGPE